MTIPYTFANATGTIPLQELDDNFANVYQYVLTAGNVVNSTQANIRAVGVLNSLNVSGNASVFGNVTGNYILGNGTFLTGMYGNSNVANYLPTNPTILTIQNGLVAVNANVANTNANVSALSNTVANISAASGNIDGGLANTNANLANTNSNVANLTSSLANTNSNVSNVYTSLVGVNNVVANNTANINTLQGQVYANSNVRAYLSTYNNTVGNISGFTFSSSTGGSPYVLQGNTNAYLRLDSPNNVRFANDTGNAEIWSGNTIYQFSANALSTTANITAANFAGNGWQISNVRYTNIYGAYGNADVAIYLANTNIGITTTGNITASRFLGNGSQLTNLRASGNDTEIQFNNAGSFGASANLTFSDSQNQLTVGNVLTRQIASPNFANLVLLNSDAAGGFAQYEWTLSGAKLVMPTARASDNVTGLFSNVSNIRLAANTANLTLQTNGVITLPDGSVIDQGGLYGATTGILGNADGNVQVYAQDSGIGLQTFDGTEYYTWFFNDTGNLAAPANGTVQAGYFKGDGSQLTNINAGNITGSYGNANVAAYLPTYTGNVSANYFIGNGSLLTSLPAPSVTEANTSSNANVMVYNGNLRYTTTVTITPSSGNINTGGNIAADHFIGDGSLLTNLPAGNASSLSNSAARFTLLSDNTLVLGNVLAPDNFVVNTSTPDIDLRNAVNAGMYTQGQAVNINGDSNVTVALRSHNWVFGGDATLTFPDGTVTTGNSIVTEPTADFSINTSSLTSVTAPCYIGLLTEYVADTENDTAITAVRVGWTVIVNSVEYTVTSIDPSPPANQYRITVDGAAGFVSGASYTFTNPVPRATWTFDPSGNLTLPGNTSSINYANGTPYGGAAGLPLANGSSNFDIATSGGNATVTVAGLETWTFDTNGNLTIPGDIVGTATINIDNRATGNSADIQLYSADDITLQARDRTLGSGSEGGDINIFAGDSAEDSDATGGDVTIEAGNGGASNVDFGGSGGTVTIQSGRGGDASTGNGYGARSGGALNLRAGNAGDNMGNIYRGGAGGNMFIEAGDSTGNGLVGGSIFLVTGTAGANAEAGDLQIQVPSSDSGPGGTWRFNGMGVLEFPGGGTIRNSDSLDIGGGNAVSLEAASVVNIYSDTNGNAYQWQFGDDGNLTAPGSIEIGTGNVGVQLRSNPTGTGFYTSISNITSGANTVVVTLNDVEFIEGDQGTVRITDVVGETEANGFWGWQSVEVDQIQLYTDGTFTTPVNGNTWNAYVSGGLAVSSGYNNLDIQGGNVAIISGAGKYWSFNPDGNLILPDVDSPSINYANGTPYGGGGGSVYTTPYEVAAFEANTPPGFGDITFCNLQGANSAPATAQKLFIDASPTNEQSLGTIFQQWTSNSYRGTLSLNNGSDSQATFNISNGRIYFDPENYRGFRAGLNQIWGDDCSINQLIITNASAPNFYNTEFLVEDDVFHASGLATGNFHVMLNIYGSSQYNPINPNDLWNTFVAFVDNVLFNGETLRTDVDAIRTQFYNNAGNFRGNIPTQDLYQYFEFTDSEGADYFGRAPTTASQGTGATVRIRVNPNNTYTVLGIADPGVGYLQGDNLFVAGTALGGASPANNLTLLIDTVDLEGRVTAVSFLSGTGAYPWPSNSISDGDDDQYDTGNYINTNLADEISYANGLPQTNSAAFGGGDYCVMYYQSFFCMVATGVSSSVTDLFYSGNLGFDGDGFLNWTGLRSNQNVVANNNALYAYFDCEYLDGEITPTVGTTYNMTLDSAGINLDGFYAYYDNNIEDYFFGSNNSWRVESQNELYVQSYNDLFIRTLVNQRGINESGPSINIDAGNGSPGQREINATAGNGGTVNIRGGDAGSSNDIDSLGNTGGDVIIEGGQASGNSTGGTVHIRGGVPNNGSAGNIRLTTYNGVLGNGSVDIYTTNGTERNWSFDATGNLVLPVNGNVINRNGTDLFVTTFDNNGLTNSSLEMSPNDTLTRVEQWSSQQAETFNNSDWSSGTYTVEAGVGAIQFTNASNVISFINSLNGVGQIYLGVNGGPQLVWDGTSSGDGAITFYTPTLPENDPTSVTSFTYYYSYKSGFEIDYDSDEVNIYANDADINLQTTNLGDIVITSDRDMSMSGNGDVTITNYNSVSPVTIISNANGTLNQWQFDETGNLILPGNTFAVNYANGTQVNIGGGSANTGNVTFGNNIVFGTGDEFGSNGLYLAPGPASITSVAGNVQYLKVRGGDAPTHIHLDTGNNAYYDQYFGDDNKYLKLSAGATGNIVIGTDDDNGNRYTWTHDSTGNLTIPGNIQTITTGFSFTANVTGVDTTTTPGNVYITLSSSPFPDAVIGRVTVTGIVGTTEANGTWYFRASEVDQFQLFYGPNGTFPVDGTGWPSYVSGGLAVSAGYNDLDITGGNISIVNNIGNTWTFDNTGNLTLPGTLVVPGTLAVIGAGFESVPVTNENGIPGGAGGSTVTGTVADNPGINTIQPGWIVTGNNLTSTTRVTSVVETAPGFYTITTDTDEVNPFTYNDVYTFTDAVYNTWNFGTSGNLTLPTIALDSGNTINEQTVIQSQRKIIPPFRWSVEIDGTTPTVIYTATDNSITSMKVTVQIQHQGLGMEFFEVFATFTGSDTYYSVNNRVAPPTIDVSDVVVGLAAGNTMKITVTVNSGVATSWVTYDAVEFGIAND